MKPADIALDQPVHAVKGRRLVALRQRGIVENRVDEIIDRAAECHHRLTDVDQLAGAFADDVHAQQLVVLAMKDQLEHTDSIAQDLPARDLLVISFADLVGDARRRQFFFVGAASRNLGNGVYAIRE